GRHDELEDHVLIASAASAERRQPPAPEDRNRAVLGPGWDVDGDLAFQGGHEHLAADHRGGHRYLGRRDELGPLAREALVLGHVDLDVEIPFSGTRLPGVTRSGDSNSLAVLDSSRDVDLPGALIAYPAGASAALAGRLGDAPVAAAAIARH